MIYNVQLKYYVPAIKSSLNYIKSKCPRCILLRAKPVYPQMACISDSRLNIHAPPFTNTGVDYFGPFEVKVKRSTEKMGSYIVAY